MASFFFLSRNMLIYIYIYITLKNFLSDEIYVFVFYIILQNIVK